MRLSAPLIVVVASACAPQGQLVGGTAPSSARILDPGCAGSPYVDIQDAIDQAADQDVIEICAGTFIERFTVSGKALTLRARDGLGSTIIDANNWGIGLEISAGADITVEGLTFVNGGYGSVGGNISCTDSDLVVTDSRFETGRATSGGGIGAVQCTGSISDSSFDGNTAWRGGGIGILGGAMVLSNLELVGNHSDWSGGGVYVSGDADLSDSTFDGNTSDVYGAGAFYDVSASEIANCLFTNNASGNDGAGLYVSEGTPTVRDNTFDSNIASDDAGGLRTKLSLATVTGNTFTNNHANNRGGGTKVSHEIVFMSGNTFTGNTSWVGGGGALMEESESVLSNNTFTDNDAPRGGGMYITNGWGDMVLEDSTFMGNTATIEGGGLYINLPGQTVTLSRVNVLMGSAPTGGGISAINSDVELVNTLVGANSATNKGGGLYLNNTTGRIENAVLYRNNSGNGAALKMDAGTLFDVVNTNLSVNLGGGAAIDVGTGAAPAVSYSNFKQNSSNFSGMSNMVGIDGNVSLRPQFVNPNAGNFHLRPNSPLIDRGDPAILDTNGTASDIGMYGGPGAN